jgi:hypothetical protein
VFDFAKEGAGTKVSWSMEGTMSFGLFFFKGMMTTFVGMDYERALCREAHRALSSYWERVVGEHVARAGKVVSEEQEVRVV